jgi:hypothetical protein
MDQAYRLFRPLNTVRSPSMFFLVFLCLVYLTYDIVTCITVAMFGNGRYTRSCGNYIQSIARQPSMTTIKGLLKAVFSVGSALSLYSENPRAFVQFSRKSACVKWAPAWGPISWELAVLFRSCCKSATAKRRLYV